MPLLTFSQFVNVLFPFLRNGESETQFIKMLTNQIMKGKPGAKTYDNKSRNPILNKSDRAIQYYFSGERSISQEDASIILSSCDKYKFEEYMRSQCSEDCLLQLKEELERLLPEGTIGEKCDIVAFCADLFADILKDLAFGRADKRKKGV